MSNFGPGLSLCRFTSQSALLHPTAQRPLTLTTAVAVAAKLQHRTAMKSVQVLSVVPDHSACSGHVSDNETNQASGLLETLDEHQILAGVIDLRKQEIAPVRRYRETEIHGSFDFHDFARDPASVVEKAHRGGPVCFRSGDKIKPFRRDGEVAPENRADDAALHAAINRPSPNAVDPTALDVIKPSAIRRNLSTRSRSIRPSTVHPSHGSR
jgi:hypothetical protein